jgi:hypothetical protein
MVYLTSAAPPPPPTATADNNATASEAPPDWMYTRELIAIFGKKRFSVSPVAKISVKGYLKWKILINIRLFCSARLDVHQGAHRYFW